MNIDEAVIRACEETTLVSALSWIAVWETERVVAQAVRCDETGVRTASHGGEWDTCFGYCFSRLLAAWDNRKTRATANGDGQKIDAPTVATGFQPVAVQHSAIEKFFSMGILASVLEPLVAIAEAYEDDELDEARPERQRGIEHDRRVELLCGRGGRRCLLTLGQALDARDLLRRLRP